MAKVPHPTDKFVGSRVRMRRLMFKMSQEKLGQELGLTFQQVQKYEKGTNRISASRLQDLARILDVPVPFFFEGGPKLPGQPRKDSQPPMPSYVTDMLATSQGLDLIRAFSKLDDTKLRRMIVRLVEAIAGDEEED